MSAQQQQFHCQKKRNENKGDNHPLCRELHYFTRPNVRILTVDVNCTWPHQRAKPNKRIFWGDRTFRGSTCLLPRSRWAAGEVLCAFCHIPFHDLYLYLCIRFERPSIFSSKNEPGEPQIGYAGLLSLN